MDEKTLSCLRIISPPVGPFEPGFYSVLIIEFSSVLPLDPVRENSLICTSMNPSYDLQSTLFDFDVINLSTPVLGSTTIILCFSQVSLVLVPHAPYNQHQSLALAQIPQRRQGCAVLGTMELV